MKSINSFRKKALLIIVSISALFLFNLFWLWNLYHSYRENIIQNVLSCIEDADNDEMQHRLNILSQNTYSDSFVLIEKSITVDDSLQSSSVLETSITRSIDGSSKTVDVRETSIDGAIDDLIKEVRMVLHHNIDSILPVNLNVLDSMVNRKLYSKGITSQLYYSELVDLSNDSVLLSSLNPTRSYGKSQVLTYIYDTDNGYAYVLHLSSLTGTILKQMAGILIATFLIIVVLSIAFVFFINTITGLKTLEEMKTDFMNNMTHELKTPLAGAYSAIDALLNFRQGKDEAKKLEYIKLCETQLSHLNGLIEQILSMSKENKKRIVLNKELIYISDMAKELVKQHQLKLKDRQVEFNVSVIPPDMKVYADRTHLYNIISNLIDNAVKYSQNAAVINVDVSDDGNYSIIRVTDNGIGISKEDLEHIFEKFYRAATSRYEVKGYGLGLNYVKAMVELHNGKIIAKSSIGKGSVFTIKIPHK